ncbi:hypothetical protein GRF29_77g884837 [Pseudopithomyces chartarum]|uniref:Uncharacterized protein n=1 Tax=Pseudopithomyces chartarum TaxID=1892770 RepID=A0AAN6LXC2_9PLEO|nr:hypothetical protein GRF29_77g884837 [Pseudopithomyces chartarum]
MDTPSSHTRSKGRPLQRPLQHSHRDLRISRNPVTEPAKARIQKHKRKKSTTASTEICRRYLENKSHRACRYQHPPVCRDHLRGKCTCKCKYAHFTDPALFEYHHRMLEIEQEEKEEKDRKEKMKKEKKIEDEGMQIERGHGDVGLE